MKKFILALSFLLLASPVWAATVTLNLTWTVQNSPTVPATSYRVEELVASTWTTVGTVAAPTLTYQITGRPLGMFTFRVVPVASGLDGTPSNVAICGALQPDSILSISCTPQVVP